MNTEKLICAGFGGQGVMSMGMMIAYSGMIENKHVSWCPSYGPEMRGGTANCSVIVSDNEVASPIVINDATIVVVMNLPSFKKFESAVKTGRLLLINSSLISEKSSRTDIDVKYINANHIAEDINASKAANMVMLGALIKLKPIVEVETLTKAFLKVFGEDKAKFLPMNEEALSKGAMAV